MPPWGQEVMSRAVAAAAPLEEETCRVQTTTKITILMNILARWYHEHLALVLALYICIY
jgi:hypothetical protein